jgi:hypothetical protein
MTCSPDARIQITKESFQLQTSRKVEFRKTTNEMVSTVCVTSKQV